MKTIIKSVVSTLLLSVYIQSVLGQDIKPLKPKKLVDTLNYPLAAIDKHQAIREIPKSVKFGLITNTGAKLEGSYTIKGKISTKTANSFTILNQAKKEVSILYKVPQPVKLNLKTGDEVVIDKTSKLSGAGLNYIEQIKSNNAVKFISLKQSGDKPLKLQLLPGVQLKQSAIIPASKRESEYMTTAKLGIIVSTRSGVNHVTDRKIEEIILNGVPYYLYVETSSFTKVKPGIQYSEAAAEEYLLIAYLIAKN